MKTSIVITLVFCFLCSCGQTVKETFLIPAGFQGRINIIFNQPDKPLIPINNGRRVYHIPADGILVTSSKLETGTIDQEYYYTEGDRLTKVPVQDLNTNEDAPIEPAVVSYGITGVYGNSTDVNPLDYAESIIASKTTIDSIYSQTSQTAFDEIVKRKVGRSF